MACVCWSVCLGGGWHLSVEFESVAMYILTKRQRSWSSFSVLTLISCTFLTQSLIRNSPFKVLAKYLSWGNVPLMCSCRVRSLVLCHTGGLAGSPGQTLPARRCTSLRLVSWCPTYSTWFLCPNGASDSASATPALTSAGVSALSSQETDEGFFLVVGCCAVWCKSQKTELCFSGESWPVSLRGGPLPPYRGIFPVWHVPPVL